MNAFGRRDKSQTKIAATRVVDQPSSIVKKFIIIRIEET